jgi:outer membrane protein
MKKLPLIINVVLFIAIAVLYVLHFTGLGLGKYKSTNNKLNLGTLNANNGIVYINIDTVMNHYDMYTDLQGELEKKYNTSQAELASKEEAYKRDVSDYQYKIQRGLVTRSEAQKIEEQLYAQQQNYLKLQQDMSQELNEKQQVMSRQVMNTVMDYLKNNQSEYSYKYVLGTSFGGNILYANDSLDITQNIIQGLNDTYMKDKKKKEK